MWFEAFNYCGHGPKGFGIIMGRTGDNQRCAGFIYEYIVYFVDNGIMMAALCAGFKPHSHVVTQIVETELIVGPVGNIRLVGLLTIN